MDNEKQPIRIVMAPSESDKSPLAFPVRVFLGEMEVKGLISAYLGMQSDLSHTRLYLELVPVDGLKVEQPEVLKEKVVEFDMRDGTLNS